MNSDKYNYRQIGNFAESINKNNSYYDNPLSYGLTEWLDADFLHGSTGRQFGKYSKNFQAFSADYCAKNWNGVCEAMSRDRNHIFPNNLGYLETKKTMNMEREAAGDILLKNTAYAKYMSKDSKCNFSCEPFDPTSANSVMICLPKQGQCGIGPSPYTVCSSGACGQTAPSCFLFYEITADQAAVIDEDPVMNKILAKPDIAPELLKNIYNTMKRKGTLSLLKGSKLGNFFNVI